MERGFSPLFQGVPGRHPCCIFDSYPQRAGWASRTLEGAGGRVSASRDKPDGCGGPERSLSRSDVWFSLSILFYNKKEKAQTYHFVLMMTIKIS